MILLQALWSYTGDEILFDRQFVSTISHRHGRWQVDFSKLSLTSHCQPQPQERDDETTPTQTTRLPTSDLHGEY